MNSNLAGLYIQIEAKKRRIKIINVWKCSEIGHIEAPHYPSSVILRPAFFSGRRIYGLVGSGSWCQLGCTGHDYGGNRQNRPRRCAAVSSSTRQRKGPYRLETEPLRTRPREVRLLWLDKFVSPIVFPLILLGLFWFSERNKSPDHKPNRDRMRFWIGCWTLLALGELSLSHGTTKSDHAWQSHPTVTCLLNARDFRGDKLVAAIARTQLKKIFLAPTAAANPPAPSHHAPGNTSPAPDTSAPPPHTSHTPHCDKKHAPPA